MSAAALVSFRAPVLAWADAADDERLFKLVTRTVLITTTLICLLLLFWPQAKPDRSKQEALPPRMAKMLLERETPPPPIKAKAKTEPEVPTKAVEREPIKPEPRRAEPRAVQERTGVVVPEAREPVANKPAGEVEAARRKVAGIGLLAAKDDLAQMSGAPVAVQLRTDIKQGSGVGSNAGVGVGSAQEAGLPSRALITSNATGGSGGINTAAYSRSTGGGGLAGRSTTLVEGAAGGGGGGGAGGGGLRGRAGTNMSGAGGSGGTGGGQREGGGKPSRAIEDIRLVLERVKPSLYNIYQRALREDPTLQGRVVVEFTIAPSGGVVSCKILSSELHAPEVEAKLIARLKMADFGAKDVGETTKSWPLDFLPS